MTGTRGRPARHQPDVAYGDTNLFVALLVGTDHPLHDRALAVFLRVAGAELVLIVTPVVLAELVYVARSVLGWTRRVAAERIGSLIEADGLLLTEPATLRRAVALYGSSAKLDFADAYLSAAALEAGPPVVASFDSDFDAVEGIRRISA